MAKMLVNFAEKYGFVDANSKISQAGDCKNFADIDYLKNQDLHEYVIRACEYGIMWRDSASNGVAKNFAPQQKVSRAIFATALDRVLSKDLNNGEGSDWYTLHLKALNKLWIMKDTNNAGRDVIKGDVLLMLHRSVTNIAEKMKETSECTKLEQVVCMLGGDCSEACSKIVDVETTEPGNNTGDEKVKSGKLIVKATAAEGRKAIKNGGVSDLDTITLKASETITVDSITLERFGYSSTNDVANIWLENGNGEKITDPKELSSSKDTVTLKINKEYKDMDASNAITIVLETAGYTSEYGPDKTNKPGSTIGFKVKAVDASAKDLDLSDYDPYTYELVDYDGSKITVSVKGNDKEYNYSEGEYYEVSRIKVKAGSAMINVDGMTLTNMANEFDLDEFVSKVKVTIDGKDAKNLSYNVTKDNEIVLAWDSVEVAINKDVQIVVSIAMKDFDEFGKSVVLWLKEAGDLKATEKKTGARVTIDTLPSNYKVYTFNGSKIKFSNTKLASTIEAAQGASDVVIAQGDVTVGEEVKIKELVFNANTADTIEDMHITVAGETYDATVLNNKTTFTFKNVVIEKSGKFEMSVDLVDEETIVGSTVEITPTINKTIFSGQNGRYEETRKDVNENDVSGSISISKVKVQASKASLRNNETKTVEFVQGETSDRVTVFKGTYTAKKSDITLKEFAIAGDNTKFDGDTTAEFYVYVDGEEIGMIDEKDIEADGSVDANSDNYKDFSDEVVVKAGNSVSVEIKAVIAPDQSSNPTIDLTLHVRGEDSNGTIAGYAKATMQTMKFVTNGSLTISDSVTMSKNTVALQANEITMAKFVLKPSKSDSVKLDNLVFDFSKLNVTDIENDITVEVDGEEVDIDDMSDTTAVVYDGSSIDDIKGEVEVVVKVKGLVPSSNYATAEEITLVSVNNVEKNSTYTRLVLPAIVTFDSVSSDGAVTKFKVNVDDYDGAQISNVKLYTASITDWEGEAGTVTNGSTIEVSNKTTSEVVTKVTFDITIDADKKSVSILRDDYADYFKLKNGNSVRVSKVSDN